MGNEQMKKKDEALFAAVYRVQSGDQTAWSEMYELSCRYLYKIIYDIVKDTNTTEDLLQETYLQIYNKINTLQEASAFYVWAGRIATNFTLRYIQKYRKEVLVTADEEGNTDYAFENASEDNELFIPETIMQDAETRRLLGEILDALPIAQKLTIQYYYYEEMSVHAIAEVMETTDGTVKSRLNYARKAIKDAVLSLEKNENTKLYSLASLPLFYLFFRESIGTFFAENAAAAASVASTTKAGIVEKIGVAKTGAAPKASVAAKAGGTAKAGASTFFATAAGKVAIGAIAAVVVAGGVGTGIALSTSGNANTHEAGATYSPDTEEISTDTETASEEIEVNTEDFYRELVEKVNANGNGQGYVDKYGAVIIEEFGEGEKLEVIRYYLPNASGEHNLVWSVDSYRSSDLLATLNFSSGEAVLQDNVKQGDEVEYYEYGGFGFEPIDASHVTKVEVLSDGWKLYTSGEGTEADSYVINSDYEIICEEYWGGVAVKLRFDAAAKGECENFLNDTRNTIEKLLGQ